MPSYLISPKRLTASHQRLLSKLEFYGIYGPTRSWIGGFLANRTQRVSVNGVLSDLASVSSGVPQGSVLGPALFLLYINNISDGIRSDLRLFADDSIVYREINSNTDHLILQQDLEHLKDWAHRWQMDFNISKCFLLSITLKKQPSDFTYILSGQTITRTDSHPYLGINIDSKLSWRPHVNEVTAKASRLLGLLQRTLGPCKRQVKETAYRALVRPRLEYGAAAWNPHTNLHVDKLEKVQRSAARFVVGDHRRTSSVTTMLNNLGWQRLETRRLHLQMIMLYKIKYNMVKISLPPCILPPTIITRRSNPHKFTQPHSRINAYQYSFYPRAVRAWNLLTLTTITAPDLTGFKASLCEQVLTAPAHLTRL